MMNQSMDHQNPIKTTGSGFGDYLSMAGLRSSVDQVIAKAEETLSKLKKRFYFCFLSCNLLVNKSLKKEK